jgi:DNA/RNA-binding domain of Phe-tRNA-synthetase-like protein
MKTLKIDSAYTEKVTGFKLGILVADVATTNDNELLQTHMLMAFEAIQKSMKVEQISQLDPIKAGRAAYRAFGKDPTRYRLSCEKLLRRILKGEGLDFINNIVDLSNLISLTKVCPVGTFDYDKLGEEMILSAGKEGESYLSLGNQELNLVGLPVFYDETGPFGSTTSDSSRTNVDLGTSKIVMSLFGFDEKFDLSSALDDAEQLLIDFASAKIYCKEIVDAKKELQF